MPEVRFAFRTGHVASPPHGAVDPVPDAPPPPRGRAWLAVGRRGEGRGDRGPSTSAPGSAPTGPTSVVSSTRPSVPRSDGSSVATGSMDLLHDHAADPAQVAPPARSAKVDVPRRPGRSPADRP